MDESSLPSCTSLDDVVADLLQVLPAERQAEFAAIPLDRVVGRCHHGLGQHIRNRYLWSNFDLVLACGACQPDDASTIVMKALWHRLHPEVTGSVVAGGPKP